MLQLQHLTGHRGGKPRRWTEALLHLHDTISENPRPIVFDEFQWMANYRHELISELKFVWDRFLSKLPGQKLILCGSIASFMVEKVAKSSALYGRIETELEVPAFKLCGNLANDREVVSDEQAGKPVLRLQLLEQGENLLLYGTSRAEIGSSATTSRGRGDHRSR
jgi:hypothetical protein